MFFIEKYSNVDTTMKNSGTVFVEQTQLLDSVVQSLINK